MLVVDAKRRAALKSNCSVHKSTSNLQNTKNEFKPVDKSSEDLIYRGFLRDLGKVYGKFGVDSESMEFNKVDCLQMLIDLGFVIQ